MRIIKAVNKNNKEIILTNTPPYVLQNFEFKTGVNIYNSKGMDQDGAFYEGNTIGTGEVTLQFLVLGNDEEQLKRERRLINNIFNPKLNETTLIYNNKRIECVVNELPFFSPQYKNAEVCLINLTAHDPFWQSPNIEEEPMAAFVELFEFPSDYWDDEMYFEMGSEGHRRTFSNNGDVAVPIKIRIKGPTLNPTLTNLTTGKVIKVNRQLGEEDVLEISTDDDELYVELNGVNVFNWIDLNSEFWHLQVGENEIEYTADAGIESATLDIEWQEQYIGV